MLTRVRCKGLRQQIRPYGEEAGIAPTVLQRAMDRSDAAMTRAYQQRQVIWTRQHGEATEAALFGKSVLKKRGLTLGVFELPRVGVEAIYPIPTYAEREPKNLTFTSTRPRRTA